MTPAAPPLRLPGRPAGRNLPLMTELRLLYVTTKNAEQARALGQELLRRNLIACANILPQMESIYRWKGEIQNDQETVVIFKTQRALVPQATKAIEELHEYETPCVLELPIESGSQGYLNWLLQETQPPSR